MAITNLQLNVRANTARALTDFKRFSSRLDNQFLISGLKLDVVRNAMSQINQEFQRSIGEQGLMGASSLRAAQNQAAMLTQIFKGFSEDASMSITTNISAALNNVAVRAGGTMKDVQKTLSATPFFDMNLSQADKNKLSEQLLAFQRDFRRAGMGDNFAGIAQQFLSNKVTGRDLVNTGDAMSSFLGTEIIKRAGGQGFIDSPVRRTEVLMEILGDEQTISRLRELAKRTAGFRIVLEDLNTQLFNTESGVFGSLRKVIDRFGKETTMFDEVQKLVDQVFGPSGFFKTLFSSIKEIFNVGDPLRPLIDAVQFITGIFSRITEYFKSEQFKTILFLVKDTFQRITEFVTSLYRSVKEAIPEDAFARITGVFKELRQQINSGTFDPSNIIGFIQDLGEGIRDYIRKIGRILRDRDDTKEMSFGAEIGATLLAEIGKTAIVLIKELFATLIDKVPEIATAVLPALNRAINSLMTELFGQFGNSAKMAMAMMPGPVGMIARASVITDATGGRGSLGALGAMAPFLLAGGGGLGGGLGRLVTGMGRGPMAMRALGLGMMGLDPITSLAGAFAPGIIGQGARTLLSTGRQISSVARPVGNIFTGPINRSVDLAGRYLSGGAGNLSSYGGSAVNLAGNLFSTGRTNASRLASNISNFATSRSNSVQGFFRGQRSQFMAGFRPPFPNVAVGAGTTRAYNVGQFFRNAPSNISSSWGGFLNSLSGMGTGIANSAKSSAASLASSSSRLGSGIASLGKSLTRYSSATLLEIQRAARMFSLGASGSAVFTRGRPMVQAGMTFSRVAPIALAGGAIVAGSQILGNQIGGSRGSQISGVGSVLGSGMSGAAIGATIGSIIPGVGTAVGAVIGGIIGGVAPLLDKGVRDGVSEFVDNISRGFRDTWNFFTRGFGDLMDWAGKGLQNALKVMVNGFVGLLNATLSAATALPRTIATVIQGIWEQAPGPVKDQLSGVGELLSAAVSVTSYQIPTLYKGLNFAGPALSLEARMSGRNPLIVNDGEFVIPSNGFATLAGLVGENLRNSNTVNQGSGGPVQVQVNLTVNTTSFVADASRITEELKQPVITIINDAWTEAMESNNVLRSKMS